MRTVRCKEINVEKFVEALKSKGYQASVEKAPVSDHVFKEASFLDNDTRDQMYIEDTKGMAGIRTDASGNQCHKIFQEVLGSSLTPN